MTWVAAGRLRLGRWLHIRALRPRIVASATAAALICSSASSRAAEELSYPELISWLTDFERLALLPGPGEHTGLASSYDRSRRYDPAIDRYIAWGANKDGAGVVRHEAEGDVFADLKGPGAIVRIWTATAGPGAVKLYIDGHETPAVDAPFARFFDHTLPPFAAPNIVYVLKQGAPASNNYVPIPFRRSLKIVGAPDWGKYFQFTYVQFPRDVASFAIPVSSEVEAALAAADHKLGNPDADPTGSGSATAGSTHAIDVTADGGAAKTILDMAGPAAITRLRIKLDLPKDIEAQRRLLRELAIKITWDGDAAPSVWSPLGDFFGFFGGAQAFAAYPSGVSADGQFYSNWYMPFGSRAKIEIVNDGSDATPIHAEINTAPLRFPIQAYGRFHAKWHRDVFLPSRADRAPDWTLLTTSGRGRYVGVHLHVWNPAGKWWGEGDEKFFVDGEKFPSEIGTGTEDYFGYAWSNPKLFSEPFHNQILNEHNAGHIINNRWHFADSVPFQTAFEASIEKYFPNARPTLYAAVAYWYLAPSGRDPYVPAPLTDRIGYWSAAATQAPGAQ